MGIEIAVHAQHRRHADGQVHIGAALLRAELQERVDTRHSQSCPFKEVSTADV